MLNNTFTWNGHSSDEYGIFIERKPNLDRSARKFQTASVPGRNGNIYQLQDAWEEVIVSYEIFAGGPQEGNAVGAFTNVMEWLNSANGYAKLSDTYDSTHYRLGVFVDLTTITSKWHAHGRAIVSFRCRPERFLVTSALTPTSGSTIANSTKHTAEPIITLTGSGAMSMLRLGNKSKYTGEMPFPLESAITDFIVRNRNSYYFAMDVWDEEKVEVIDDLTFISWYIMDSLATASSLVDSTGVLQYTTSDSNYNWGVGICVAVTPGTYTLSWEADKKSKVRVLFINSSGFNRIEGIASGVTNNASGWTAQSLTFNVPPECGYILVHFGRQVKTDSIPNYRKIMLNAGSTALTFYGWDTTYTSTLTINNTSITIDGKFASGVIDCEAESVTLDGESGNTKVKVKDQYGNLSTEFLNFKTGNNTITFGNVITAVSIDPRFWEL